MRSGLLDKVVENPYKPKRRYSHEEEEEEEDCNPLSDIFPEGNTSNLKPFLPEPDETKFMKNILIEYQLHHHKNVNEGKQ